LEFIGDKALDTAVIGILNDRYAKLINAQLVSDLTEGDLTELKKKLVDKKNLSKRMDVLGYHQYLKMGKGDILKKVQEDDSVKEDLFEAIIGAVWIDSDHDFKIIKKVVEVMLDTSSFFDNAQENEDENYIGLLQEWCQKKHFDIPVYEITPLQNGRFGCTCFVDAIEEPTYDEGPNKDEARMRAAKAMYGYLEENHLLHSMKDEIVAPSLEKAINQLQELAQKGYISLPYYIYLDIVDKDGHPMWRCECHIEEEDYFSTATGLIKKDVKKAAAYQMLLHVLKTRG
jgi:ribonuclease-3